MYYLKDKEKIIGVIYSIDEHYYFIYSVEKYSDIMTQLLLDISEDMRYTTDIERYFKYWINDIHIERRTKKWKNMVFYLIIMKNKQERL